MIENWKRLSVQAARRRAQRILEIKPLRRQHQDRAGYGSDRVGQTPLGFPSYSASVAENISATRSHSHPTSLQPIQWRKLNPPRQPDNPVKHDSGYSFFSARRLRRLKRARRHIWLRSRPRPAPPVPWCAKGNGPLAGACKRAGNLVTFPPAQPLTAPGFGDVFTNPFTSQSIDPISQRSGGPDVLKSAANAG